MRILGRHCLCAILTVARSNLICRIKGSSKIAVDDSVHGFLSESDLLTTSIASF